jgi:hypothetical protein
LFPNKIAVLNIIKIDDKNHQCGDGLPPFSPMSSQYLKDVTRKKATVGETNRFNRFFPYAASYGFLHQWAKFFQKEGQTELSPYFQTLDRADDGGMAAFVTMTATSSSSGGSAAGGGASGAG